MHVESGKGEAISRSHPPKLRSVNWQRFGGSSGATSDEFCWSHSRNCCIACGDVSRNRRPASSRAPSHANSACRSMKRSVPGSANEICQRALGRRLFVRRTAMPPSLTSMVLTHAIAERGILDTCPPSEP
jgi:hypothetical protein